MILQHFFYFNTGRSSRKRKMNSKYVDGYAMGLSASLYEEEQNSLDEFTPPEPPKKKKVSSVSVLRST